MPPKAAFSSAPSQPPDPSAKSLYVGGLDPRVCTELLHEVFSLAGEVTLCRVVSDKHTGASMGFGFVDYPDHASALKAQHLLHGRSVYGQELTVDWAHATSNAAAGRLAAGATPTGRTGPQSAAGALGPGTKGQPDASDNVANHYCLFIGNLDASVTDQDMRSTFSKYGECSSAQVSRDASANSKRCAFVSFPDRASAQAAIDGLNGYTIAGRPMRVDWARAKTNAVTRAAALGLPEVDASAAQSTTPNAQDESGNGGGRRIDLAAVMAQTSPAVTTIYVSGLPPTIDEATLRSEFGSFGPIAEIRIPESARHQSSDKIYAFVVFNDHETAARAILDSQGNRLVAGRSVAVQWGREGNRSTAGPRRGYPGGMRGLGTVHQPYAASHGYAPYAAQGYGGSYHGHAGQGGYAQASQPRGPLGASGYHGQMSQMQSAQTAGPHGQGAPYSAPGHHMPSSNTWLSQNPRTHQHPGRGHP